ncbi:helix-turn-helix transcriptional regulator [Lentzea sp. NPDC004782]|uniref:helix-turn-helix domain-containing protein n=1 Tax=Lentzea sp. NPDC004782 TaxID=3154458 RepID=UPI0033B424F6
MRAAIAQTSLTAREIAGVLGWQEAKVSDMVNGKGGVSRLEVAVLLGLCRLPPAERDHLLALYPARHLEGWWQPHGRCAPARPRTALTHLAMAKTVVSWHTHAIPTPLRTAAYMRAMLLASATVPEDEIEERLLALCEMQALLRNGPDCTFFIHDLALDLQVGELDDHVGQFQHLLRMANRRKIKIRILPTSTRAHAGMGGPFTQLTFANLKPLVWIENENSSLFVEQKDQVEGYEAVVRALGEVSLTEEESMNLIARRCVRLQEVDEAEEAEQKDPDDPFPPR